MNKAIRRAVSLSLGFGAAGILAVMGSGVAAASTGSMYDFDADGYYDHYVSDTSGDGYLDQNVVTVNGAYVWLRDGNQNWRQDSIGVDRNNDGYPDFWVLDANEDGIADGFFDAFTATNPVASSSLSPEVLTRLADPRIFVASFG